MLAGGGLELCRWPVSNTRSSLLGLTLARAFTSLALAQQLLGTMSDLSALLDGPAGCRLPIISPLTVTRSSLRR